MVELAIYLLEYEYDWSESPAPRPPRMVEDTEGRESKANVTPPPHTTAREFQRNEREIPAPAAPTVKANTTAGTEPEAGPGGSERPQRHTNRVPRKETAGVLCPYCNSLLDSESYCPNCRNIIG